MARILVVDDEAVVRDIVVEVLKQEGHEVYAAEGPSSATELIKENAPDLIVSDIWMDGTDGLAFLHTIRTNARTRTIPLILITACAPADIQLWAAAALPQCLLLKPFPIDDLRTAVRRRLQGNEAVLTGNPQN